MVLGTGEKIVLAFITLLVGVVLISTVATQTLDVTSTTSVSNEALSIAAARFGANNINSTTFTLQIQGNSDAGGWEDNSVFITNSTGTTLAGNYTVNYATQRITFLNNTYMVNQGGAGNNTLVDYKYYADSYIQQSFGRSAVLLIGGFFALALMMISIGFFYSVAKDARII